MDTSWALCILQTKVALRACWGLPPLKCTQRWSIAHRYSSEYKNGEDRRCSDLLKALAVEVSGPHYDFECRLKESKLHIGVELELFGVIHTENTIEKKRESKTLFCRASVLCATVLSTVVPKGMPVASWQLLQFTVRKNVGSRQILYKIIPVQSLMLK